MAIANIVAHVIANVIKVERVGTDCFWVLVMTSSHWRCEEGSGEGGGGGSRVDDLTMRSLCRFVLFSLLGHQRLKADS